MFKGRGFPTEVITAEISASRELPPSLELSGEEESSLSEKNDSRRRFEGKAPGAAIDG